MMDNSSIKSYVEKISESISKQNEKSLMQLVVTIKQTLKKNKNIFLCGNGGSGANSIHIANDFIYYNQKRKNKLKYNVESLASNPAILTCIANDIDYENVFSFQIKTKANKDDLLIILSGSGNSKNIINAINTAKKIGVKTFGIIGFDGGKAKKILDNSIHFKFDDMQIVEDLQTIVFHVIFKNFN